VQLLSILPNVPLNISTILLLSLFRRILSTILSTMLPIALDSTLGACLTVHTKEISYSIPWYTSKFLSRYTSEFHSSLLHSILSLTLLNTFSSTLSNVHYDMLPVSLTLHVQKHCAEVFYSHIHIGVLYSDTYSVGSARDQVMSGKWNVVESI
jgi:hypothetical protein